MSDWIVRKIEKKDNEALAALIRTVFDELGIPKVGTAYEDPCLDFMFDEYQSPSSVYYVVDYQGQIVGGAGVGPLANAAETICELQKMYFLPEFRSRGIGAEIMQKCLQSAREFGFEKCYLETMPFMLAAQKLYKKVGFVGLDAPMGGTGHVSCSVWMIKDLMQKTANVKIREYRSHFMNALLSVYDQIEAESLFYLILEEKKQLRRIDLALQPDLVFSKDEVAQFDSLLDSLLKEVPIQYLLGKTSFYGLEFEVNEHVLIPRGETEELVDWIIERHGRNKELKIVDIGTGSGCIAIALAKNLPSARVFAMDVSQKALDTAQVNAHKNSVEVSFILQNILETQDLGQEFDIIVSNPPYVRELEKAEIKKNVLDHEPHLALFVKDDDPLLFYRKIAQLGKKNLYPNGCLYFEINQYMGNEMALLLQEQNFKHIVLKKDIYGNDRMIKGELDF